MPARLEIGHVAGRIHRSAMMTLRRPKRTRRRLPDSLRPARRRYAGDRTTMMPPTRRGRDGGVDDAARIGPAQGNVDHLGAVRSGEVDRLDDVGIAVLAAVVRIAVRGVRRVEREDGRFERDSHRSEAVPCRRGHGGDGGAMAFRVGDAAIRATSRLAGSILLANSGSSD